MNHSPRRNGWCCNNCANLFEFCIITLSNCENETDLSRMRAEFLETNWKESAAWFQNCTVCHQHYQALKLIASELLSGKLRVNKHIQLLIRCNMAGKYQGRLFFRRNAQKTNNQHQNCPKCILELIICSYKTWSSTASCSSTKVALACTEFCKCKGSMHCKNPMTLTPP